MTAMPTGQTMTAQEFLDLPLDMDEYGWAPCLVEGELVLTHPKVLHQAVVGDLLVAIRRWIDAGSRRGMVVGPLAVVLDSVNVYAPDLVFYTHEREPDRHDPGPYAMPDLAVEVRSPSTWRYDIGTKKAGYEREGLPELWLVDTAASQVLVFRRSDPDSSRFDVALELASGDMLESPLLPGFALPVEQLFES